MKLELKHIAPYLPYGLRINTGTEIWTIYSIANEVMPMENKDFPIGVFHEHWGYYTTSLGSKPILRPLPDLTKEIDVNGEKFIPNNEQEFKFYVKADLIYFIESPLRSDYYQMQKLFEWHFDVFGLIPENLAIDINTLKAK